MQEEPGLQSGTQQPTPCLHPGESLSRKPTQLSQPRTHRVHETVKEYWFKLLSLCSFVTQPQRTIVAWKPRSKPFNVRCKSRTEGRCTPDHLTWDTDWHGGQASRATVSVTKVTHLPLRRYHIHPAAFTPESPEGPLQSHGQQLCPREPVSRTPSPVTCQPAPGCSGNTAFLSFNLTGCCLLCLVFFVCLF